MKPSQLILVRLVNFEPASISSILLIAINDLKSVEIVQIIGLLNKLMSFVPINDQNKRTGRCRMTAG